MAKPVPYRSTPIFDDTTLPDALRREHRTKPGVWGVVVVSRGRLRLSYADGTPEFIAEPGAPGLLLPDQPHWVTPLEPFAMRVDFYSEPPMLDKEAAQ